jgi:hypothetical protein
LALLDGDFLKLPASSFAFVAALLAGAGLVAPAHGQERVVPADSASAAYQQWKLEHEAWQRNYSQWEKRYQKWQEEQSRLDDGFLFALGIGPSPMRVDTRFSGGDVINFPDTPPFPDVSLRGMGVMIDAKMGWLVENDPYLKDYWYGEDELHDQLYLTFDLITRTTPYPQWRFAETDTSNESSFLRPVYVLDIIGGPGMTYLIYPYRISLSSTVGFGLLGIQGENGSVRTQMGPAFNARIAQEWSVRENWRSGIAVNYGIAQTINPRKVNRGVYSYQENYRSYLFSIQWINSFTPPKYRRGLPPTRPQQYDTK